ncbi:protein lifeguard 4-like [Oscarella lobularis]|uniref:protein lifeguard 4-like n=1 Tax=Oscarella lobularis TaxID=121494 RepID=UPI0033137181
MSSVKDVEYGDDKEEQQTGRMSYRDSVVVAQVSVQIRLGFLRKVYGILTAQLALTVAVATLFVTVDSVKSFVRGSPTTMLVAAFATFAILIALLVKKNEHPTNLYLLAAFTLCEAYTVGVAVTFYDRLIVLEAFFLTLAVFVGLTAFTLQSKRDYSTWGASLFSFLWILILGGFLQFFIRSDSLDFVISLAGAVVFSGFIIFDTHMIMHRLSPEDYIVAAINLYLDVLNLFLYILRLLSKDNN